MAAAMQRLVGARPSDASRHQLSWINGAQGAAAGHAFSGISAGIGVGLCRQFGELRRRGPDLAMLITESSGVLLDRIAAATVQIERGEILSPQT